MLAHLAQADNPAVIKLIGMVAATGLQQDKEVSVCGDMASTPALVPLLLKAGIGSLSVAIAQAPVVKEKNGVGMVENSLEAGSVPEKPDENDDLIGAYKDLIRSYLAIRPSGLRKKISDAIGTNRSFVTQITNPNYRVPIPSQYISKIMDVCHLTVVERSNFMNAYLAAHPGQADLLNARSSAKEASFTVDLSTVEDVETREMIKRSLRSVAETLIAMSNRDKTEKQDPGR